MLAELKEYSSVEPVPHDSDAVSATHKFLEACHYLFERGILNGDISLHKADG